jgi:uncharacterized heparinase superfamily protein
VAAVRNVLLVIGRGIAEVAGVTAAVAVSVVVMVEAEFAAEFAEELCDDACVEVRALRSVARSDEDDGCRTSAGTVAAACSETSGEASAGSVGAEFFTNCESDAGVPYTSTMIRLG